MLLDLSNIINVPGQSVQFDVSFDLSEMDFFGHKPVAEPVKAVGGVRNQAGVLLLTGEISTRLHLRCDRCTDEFTSLYSVPLELILDKETVDKKNDNIFLLEGDSVNLEELVSTYFVLNMDTKALCRQDCKGICPSCGASLNNEACSCEKEIDPRLAVLRQLLKDKQD